MNNVDYNKNLSKQIEEQVQQFLNNGGTIQIIPEGVTAGETNLGRKGKAGIGNDIDNSIDDDLFDIEKEA